jgi:hypothetical protein
VVSGDSLFSIATAHCVSLAVWRLRILRSSLLNFDQCGTSNYDSVIAVPTGDAFRCLDLLFFLMEIDAIHAWMDTAQ